MKEPNRVVLDKKTKSKLGTLRNAAINHITLHEIDNKTLYRIVYMDRHPLVCAGYKQNGGLLVTTMVQSANRCQKVHRAPLILCIKFLTHFSNIKKINRMNASMQTVLYVYFAAQSSTHVQ